MTHKLKNMPKYIDNIIEKNNNLNNTIYRDKVNNDYWYAQKMRHILFFIPYHKRTLDLCLKYVKLNGIELQYVPLEYRTKEICIESINNNKQAISYVPLDIMDENFILHFIVNDIFMFRHIPLNKITINIVKYILNEDYNNELIYLIPLQFYDKEISMKILQKNSKNIKYIPKYKQDLDMALLISYTNGDYIKWLREDLKNEHVCYNAILNNYNALYYIPSKFRYNKKINLAILKHNPSNLLELPNWMITDNFIIKATLIQPHIIKYLPIHKLTHKLLKSLLLLDGKNIQYLDYRNLDIDLAMISMKQSGYNLSLISINIWRNINIDINKLKIEEINNLEKLTIDFFDKTYDFINYEILENKKSIRHIRYLNNINKFKNDIKMRILIESGIFDFNQLPKLPIEIWYHILKFY